MSDYYENIREKINYEWNNKINEENHQKQLRSQRRRVKKAHIETSNCAYGLDESGIGANEWYQSEYIFETDDADEEPNAPQKSNEISRVAALNQEVCFNWNAIWSHFHQRRTVFMSYTRFMQKKPNSRWSFSVISDEFHRFCWNEITNTQKIKQTIKREKRATPKSIAMRLQRT